MQRGPPGLSFLGRTPLLPVYSGIAMTNDWVVSDRLEPRHLLQVKAARASMHETLFSFERQPSFTIYDFTASWINLADCIANFSTPPPPRALECDGWFERPRGIMKLLLGPTPQMIVDSSTNFFIPITVVLALC